MLFGTEAAEMNFLLAVHDIFQCKFTDFIMPKLSALGNAGILWIAAALIMLCFPHSRRCGLLVSAGLVGCLIFGNALLKPLLCRPRPCWLYSVELISKIPSDFSFPSGHTYASFVSAFIIFKFHKRTGAAALIVASLIAFSRMYLYAHFPSDILGGIVLAAVIAAAVLSTNKLLTKKSLKQQ